MNTHINKVQEFKDKRNKNRVRVVAQNGNILDSTPQGYFNKSEMIHAATCSSIAYIDHYRQSLTEDQVGELRDILDSLDMSNYKQKLEALLIGLKAQKIDLMMDSFKVDDYKKYGEVYFDRFMEKINEIK